MIRGFFVILVAVASLASAQTLTVLTHSSFNLSQEVISAFEAETGIRVQFIEGGDAGETLNRAILTRDNPLADLLFGVDNALLARALAYDLFEPYESPLLDTVAPRYRFDPQNLVTPIDVGFVAFNYDRAWFAERGLTPPQDLDDLLTSDYRGLTVVMNPATSSPGLAFMLSTIARYGEAWLEFWAALRDNDAMVTDGWTSAYYTAFSRYGGDRPIVLSYATSPAAEVYFAGEALDEAPTANLLCDRCAFQQIEAIGILRGTRNREAAERFINFMLSPMVQEDIPLNMWVYPVVEGVRLPEVFERFAEEPTPEQVADIPAETIEAELTRWLDAWTQVVLQGQDPAAVR